MATTGISEGASLSSHEYGHAAPTSLWALTLGSIGVVCGDIGTSPLYALKMLSRRASPQPAGTEALALSHARWCSGWHYQLKQAAG